MTGPQVTGPREKSEAGMTLIEIMVSIAILTVMLGLTWSTISSATRIQREVEFSQARNHELRVALDRVVSDFSGVYLSTNEDENALQRRTLLVGKPAGRVPDLRMSTLTHRNLWADANESDQTVVTYLSAPDRENSRQTNWLRREQRRVSNLNPDEEPAEYDVLVSDVDQVKIDYWDYVDQEWRDSWDTTAIDAQKNRLPLRVRISVTVKDSFNNEFTLSTQTRLLMQERFLFQAQ